MADILHNPFMTASNFDMTQVQIHKSAGLVPLKNDNHHLHKQGKVLTQLVIKHHCLTTCSILMI